MKQTLFALALSFLLTPLFSSIYASSPKIKVYIDCGLALNRRSGLVSENVALLRELYGANWQSSVAWRTHKILSANDENRQILQELINVRGKDVTVRIKVDDIGCVVRIPDHGRYVMLEDDKSVKQTILRVVFANRLVNRLSQAERVKYERLWRAAEKDLQDRDVYVWPCCYGSRLLVLLPHRFSGNRGLTKYSHEVDINNHALRGLLFHEIAHTQDLSVRERTSYGPDNSHYADELLTVRAAFKEGWANYYTAIGNPLHAQNTVFTNIRKFRMECKKRTTLGTLTSQSEYIDFDYPISQTPVLCSEMVNAAIFIAMDAGGKNRKHILAAFAKTNQEYRHVNHLVKAYLDENPKDALRVLRIIDFITEFRSECSFHLNFGEEHSKEYLYGTPYEQKKKLWGDQQAFLKELWQIYLEMNGMSQASKKNKGALMWQFILDYKYLDFEKFDEEKSTPAVEKDVQLLNVSS